MAWLQVLGTKSELSDCNRSSHSECQATAASQSRKCSQKDDISVGEKNWTLTAQNDLGTVDLFDQVDLRQRGRNVFTDTVSIKVKAMQYSALFGLFLMVKSKNSFSVFLVHLFAPEEVRLLTINSRNVSLTWSWPVEHYNDLNITCQVNISDGGKSFLVRVSTEEEKKSVHFFV